MITRYTAERTKKALVKVQISANTTVTTIASHFHSGTLCFAMLLELELQQRMPTITRGRCVFAVVFFVDLEEIPFETNRAAVLFVLAIRGNILALHKVAHYE